MVASTGTCTRTSSPKRAPWTGERAAAETQNYAAQEVPGFSRAADDRCYIDALVARVVHVGRLIMARRAI